MYPLKHRQDNRGSRVGAGESLVYTGAWKGVLKDEMAVARWAGSGTAAE